MMHRVSQQRSSLLRSQRCLSSSKFVSFKRNPRKRGFADNPWLCNVATQIRLFGSTPLTSLPYPSSSSSSLPPPTIIYSDNHLLAVNKPAGWHSVPNIPKSQKKIGDRNDDKVSNSTNNQTIGSKKCLLTHLQNKGLGGGSNKDFLVPLHRIDQPCTGILLFGKTSKAASRVTTVWKGKRKKKKNKQRGDNGQISRGVLKDYLCVVPTSRVAAMMEASVSVQTTHSDESIDSGFPSSVRHAIADGAKWNQLDGLMLRQSALSSEYGSNSRPRDRHPQRRQQQQYYKDRLLKGRSVKILRRQQPGDSGYDSFNDYDHDTDNATMRPVHIKWKVVHVPTIEPAYTLLLVRSSEGARHMVRALMAQVGDCPILGDVRYWKPGGKSRRGTGYGTDADTTGTVSSSDDKKCPLGDRSVALHAYGLYFDKKQLQLGSLDTFEFRACIPPTWESFFGISNHQLQTILQKSEIAAMN